MIERQKISERERQRRSWQRAMTLPDFCQRYRIGRTKTYEEINAGRLKARKAGRRTIIAEEDAEELIAAQPDHSAADSSAEIAGLRAENADLRAKLANANAEIERLKSALHEKVVERISAKLAGDGETKPTVGDVVMTALG